MTGPDDNLPRIREERWREDYFYMEKQEIDWLETAAEISRKEARRLEKAKDEKC